MVFRQMMVYLMVFAVTGVSYGQDAPFDPDNDPGLRFWVKADDLATAGLNDGDPVMQWVDASQYGTIMAPRDTVGGDPEIVRSGAVNTNEAFWGNAVDEAPHLQYVNINGNNVPTVRFDRAMGEDGFRCHPVETTGPNCESVEGETSIGVDRLYQQNNLNLESDPDLFDPTNIGDGDDLTAFMVWNPDFTDETVTIINEQGESEVTHPIGVQMVAGKRGINPGGNSSWVFQLESRDDQQPRAERGELLMVTYRGKIQWGSDFIPPSKTWQITAMTIEEADPDDPGIGDPTTWYHSTGGELEDIGFIEVFGRLSTVHPMGIGGHSQVCCGELESFSGNIAELIVLDRWLAPEDQEWSDIESYLLQKYFEPSQDSCDLNGDGVCDAQDIDVMSQNVIDGTATKADRDALIEGASPEGFSTYIGDSDLNGQFDEQDIVAAFIAGQYLSGGAAGWAAGDWDGNLTFDDQDFVAAFIAGGYLQGPRGAATVPEPASWVLLALGMLSFVRRRK